MLGVGHDVGRRNVDCRTDVLHNLIHVTAADGFLLLRSEAMGVADHAAFGAPKGNVDDSRLPGHPHRERAHGVDGLLRVEADPALTRPAGIVVLNAKSLKDLRVPIAHADGNREMVLPRRAPQKLARSAVQIEKISDLVELHSGHLKGIERTLGAHVDLHR